jgi:hypothetical protein
MAIQRALRVKHSWEVRDAGVYLIESSHKLAHSKLATNVEMVAKVEALPAIGMLDRKQFLCYPIEDLIELVFVRPRSLALLDSYSIERFDGRSVFLEVLERFPLNKVSAAFDLCSAVDRTANRMKSSNLICQSHHLSALPFSNISVFFNIFIDFLSVVSRRYSNSWYIVSAGALDARSLLMNLIRGGLLAI